ncbi:hypothetical protein TNCV_2078251 [Trichonephila clavipes]|nr:hypothetical protein TNCV_2078251 [Trichonephila clavipes]
MMKGYFGSKYRFVKGRIRPLRIPAGRYHKVLINVLYLNHKSIDRGCDTLFQLRFNRKVRDKYLVSLYVSPQEEITNVESR